MGKIDWGKVKIKEAGRVGIGNPHTTTKLDVGGCSEILEPKLDPHKEYIVGMGDSPYTEFYLSGIVSKEQAGKPPHGNNCGCDLLKEGDIMHIGMGCPNPKNRLHVNN
jgi:hypothetical protein